MVWRSARAPAIQLGACVASISGRRYRGETLIIETPQPLPFTARNQSFPYQRFFSKYDVTDQYRAGLTTPCWEWNSARHPRTDYGMFWMDGKTHQAHRVAWIFKYGPIPPGLVLLHRCDWPPCMHIDPDNFGEDDDHFFLGTTAENNTDRDLKGHLKVLRGSHNGYSRLTSDHVREIRTLNEEGLTYKQLGKKYAVSPATISRICRGLTYKTLE